MSTSRDSRIIAPSLTLKLWTLRREYEDHRPIKRCSWSRSYH